MAKRSLSALHHVANRVPGDLLIGHLTDDGKQRLFLSRSRLRPAGVAARLRRGELDNGGERPATPILSHHGGGTRALGDSAAGVAGGGRHNARDLAATHPSARFRIARTTRRTERPWRRAMTRSKRRSRSGGPGSRWLVWPTNGRSRPPVSSPSRSSHSSIIRATEYLLGARDEAPPELEIFARMDHGGSPDDSVGHDPTFDPTTPVATSVPIR